MLNRQDQRVLPAAEGERRIHPGKEIARTAQAQPTGGRAVLAGMMDDNDRQVVSALQGAQVAENRGHLAGLVFVHLMQADKGVENKRSEERRVGKEWRLRWATEQRKEKKKKEIQ